jgi:hypothetical protein
MGKRSDSQAVIRSYDCKTAKITVSIPPALASKLRLAAVGLSVDQGDIVAAGLEQVLRGIEVKVRVIPTGPAESEGQGADGLRVAG